MNQSEITNVKAKILIVDDQPLTRNLVKSILRGVGFTEIVVAEDGEQALRQLSCNQCDLVICDWNMPKVTGLEVLKAVRQELKLHTLPFLMLTAEAYRENVVAAMKAGTNDYISKPFTAEILLNKVNQLLHSA